MNKNATISSDGNLPIGEPQSRGIANPIIRGFNPDPAICRCGDEFFIAVSSFQWWPGVPIYHSFDLRHWELFGHALTEERIVNLRRIGDSAGIWAPSLTYADGLFWLVFSPASGSRRRGYESPNYLTTAEKISGPWTEPVFLNASGNDASLFHDPDGRKYVLNTHQIRSPEGQHRVEGHAGTLLQEYDHAQRRLIGAPCNIFRGTEVGVPEGSKLYYRDGWYYLNIAEGGTEYGHCVTLARSRHIRGPYEVHPDNPILTARHDPDNPIQRAGHADFVTLDEDLVALVYLASRPIDRMSLCGRETFIARGRWGKDGWLRLDRKEPQGEVPDFGLPPHPFPQKGSFDTFDGPVLGPKWQTLRQSLGGRLDLTEKPGWLVLHPNHCLLDSIEAPAAVFRRIEDQAFTAETRLSYRPVEIQQWAGLACYYDTRHWYFLYRGFHSGDGPVIGLCGKGMSGSQRIEDLGRVVIEDIGAIDLRVECDRRRLSFFFRLDASSSWMPIGEPQDALILTDEYVEKMDPVPNFGFTGAFVGLAAWDMTLAGPLPAFDHFDYRGVEGVNANGVVM